MVRFWATAACGRQPVLDRHCTRCHDGQADAKSPWVLTGRSAGEFSSSHDTLRPLVRVGPQQHQPGGDCARTWRGRRKPPAARAERRQPSSNAAIVARGPSALVHLARRECPLLRHLQHGGARGATSRPRRSPAAPAVARSRIPIALGEEAQAVADRSDHRCCFYDLLHRLVPARRPGIEARVG